MKTGASFAKNFPAATRFPPWGLLAAAAVGAFPGAVFAQLTVDAGTASKFTITPYFSVSETYSSNVNLSSVGAKSDWITEISPGIRITSTGGRITGSLDYSLNRVLYAQNSQGSEFRSTLSALGSIEAVDKWAFIDFSGEIGQQAISAFGAPVGSGLSLNANSTQTSIFMLSPYVQGRFGSVAEYEARYRVTTSSSRDFAASDSVTQDLGFRVGGVGSGPLGLKWSLEGSQNDIDYSEGRDYRQQLARAQVSYAINSRYSAYIKQGYEYNNYLFGRGQDGNRTALGLSWTPDPDTQFSLDVDQNGEFAAIVRWAPSRRTTISYDLQQRLNGSVYSFNLAYRTPNTAWTAVASKSTNYNQGQTTATGIGSTTTTGTGSLFELLSAQYAATEPDPVKREQYEASLRAKGITPSVSAVGGFLNTGAQAQRLQQMSFALIGSRSTVTVVGTRTYTTALDTVVAAAGDAASRLPTTTQNGLSLNYSHTLTPRMFFGAVAAWDSTTGTREARTSTRSANLSLTTQFTRDTSASLGASRILFDSPTSPYNETSVTGTLNVQF